MNCFIIPRNDYRKIFLLYEILWEFEEYFFEKSVCDVKITISRARGLRSAVTKNKESRIKTIPRRKQHKQEDDQNISEQVCEIRDNLKETLRNRCWTIASPTKLSASMFFAYRWSQARAALAAAVQRVGGTDADLIWQRWYDLEVRQTDR